MSSTLPAGEHESEAKIPSTPNVKLADFLKEESVTDGSPLGLDSNPTKEYSRVNLFKKGGYHFSKPFLFKYLSARYVS